MAWIASKAAYITVLIATATLISTPNCRFSAVARANMTTPMAITTNKSTVRPPFLGLASAFCLDGTALRFMFKPPTRFACPTKDFDLGAQLQLQHGHFHHLSTSGRPKLGSRRPDAGPEASPARGRSRN
jgi:hypothetical protein